MRSLSLSLSFQLLYVLQVYRRSSKQEEQEKEKQQQTSTATIDAPSVTPIKMGRGSTQHQASCCWLLMLLIVAQTVYGKCEQGEQSTQLVDSYRHTHTRTHTRTIEISEMVVRSKQCGEGGRGRRKGNGVAEAKVSSIKHSIAAARLTSLGVHLYNYLCRHTHTDTNIHTL